MKNLYVLFLLIPFTVLSQSEQLFNKTWHVNSITVNGETKQAPISGDESEGIYLSVYDSEEPYDDIFNTNCLSVTSNVRFGYPELIFEIIESAILLGGPFDCVFIDFTVKQQFELLYNNYFMDNGAIVNYDLTNNDGCESLIFTKSNGDTVNYSTCLLGIKNKENLVFSINPNPFKDKVKIYTQNNSILQVRVYNQLGKVLIDKNHNPNTELDLGFLSTGIYYLSVQDESGKKVTKKLIK